jgi:hypothetical protein
MLSRYFTDLYLHADSLRFLQYWDFYAYEYVYLDDDVDGYLEGDSNVVEHGNTNRHPDLFRNLDTDPEFDLHTHSNFYTH